jgi:hypothetical protein
MARKAPVARIALSAGFLVLALALVPVALAGKGGKPGGGGGGSTSGGSGSLSLVMQTDLNANGLPNYGDTIKFNVSTTVTSSPYVVLTCTQGGTMVYTAQAGYFPTYPWPNDFILTAPTWPGGAANCTAALRYLSNGKWATITSMNFAVGA